MCRVLRLDRPDHAAAADSDPAGSAGYGDVWRDHRRTLIIITAGSILYAPGCAAHVATLVEERAARIMQRNAMGSSRLENAALRWRRNSIYITPALRRVATGRCLPRPDLPTDGAQDDCHAAASPPPPPEDQPEPEEEERPQDYDDEDEGNELDDLEKLKPQIKRGR